MPDFVERWAAAWGDPTPEKIRTLSDPDIVLTWPGLAEPIRGADAWASRVAGTLQRFPDLRLEVTDHAQRDDLLFISWRARATVAGVAIEWQGIDRMRMRDGVVTESLVAFDTAPLRAG
ncbi:nuclear transport factor 2 family protein [Micromonospora sp. C28SCA-DRY-2]|uniref:nuclear transport factor 2 family protein n=1 Tax=Micromonospora sp. C28SCA-DRY-2 TaxID=3059522 RepID=UPI002674A4CE|nr:nuclear transport factor 2 family protein [Micromonospora sp. C28SCA-DRY-2]MDO3703287.1 nuclear transport factor 2 family protein [Micromonospora sp. C28SCA-DRY-2]